MLSIAELYICRLITHCSQLSNKNNDTNTKTGLTWGEYDAR